MTSSVVEPAFDPDVWRKWTKPAQEKALEMLERYSDPKQIWYCKRGRSCDGRPHEGAPHRHARGDQWPPPSNEDWLSWILRGGRGSGKTRAGAEWVRKMTEHVGRIALIGATSADVRDTMIEGESGLLAVCEAAKVAVAWEPSKRRITFENGAIATGFSGEEPKRLRGPQHGAAWLDEPAHYPLIEDVWSMMMFGLRMGKRPRVCITTTPTPIQWLKDRIADPRSVSMVVSTYANEENLAESFIREMKDKYEGTRLGRQELQGEILMDVEGALWTYAILEASRVRLDADETREAFAESMDRIVVAIDPAGTSTKRSDETGIVVLGKRGTDLFVLADRSGRYTPERWAREAIGMYEHWQADAIVAEDNYGGEMVRSNLRNIDAKPRVKTVNSRRGKLIRAEPVFSLYEQAKVHHVGIFEVLESQLTEWVPGTGKSPDRLDALVHGAHELTEGHGESQIATATGLLVPRSTRRGIPGGSFTGMGRPATVRSWS